MPELPEVETVRRGLVPAMEGRRVAHMEIRRPDLRWPLPADMAARITGARVTALRRRSKYILADLSTNETWLMHLGMSGRMTISVPIPVPGTDAAPSSGQSPRESLTRPGHFVHGHPPRTAHDHVMWEMEDGTRVTYNDPRRFGAMDLFPTGSEADHPLLARLGPEPLGNAFSAETLHAAFAGRRAPVKTVLLDQRVVAGLGNIYVCEALWRARINPARPAGRIARPRIEVLAAAIRDVLREAIDAGGSTLRDYRRADGELGYFQHAFAVYGRAGQPCQTAGCEGEIRVTTQAGRSTYHCPRCQR